MFHFTNLLQTGLLHDRQSTIHFIHHVVALAVWLRSVACPVVLLTRTRLRGCRATDDMHACYPRSVPVPFTATLGLPVNLVLDCRDPFLVRVRRREVVILTGFLDMLLGSVSIIIAFGCGVLVDQLRRHRPNLNPIVCRHRVPDSGFGCHLSNKPTGDSSQRGNSHSCPARVMLTSPSTRLYRVVANNTSHDLCRPVDSKRHRRVRIERANCTSRCSVHRSPCPEIFFVQPQFQ